MFELCDNLIGIYKTYNCTKTITIDPRVYEKEKNEVNNTETNVSKDTTQQNKHVEENIDKPNNNTPSDKSIQQTPPEEIYNTSGSLFNGSSNEDNNLHWIIDD